jgi:hypothetical protein
MSKMHNIGTRWNIVAKDSPNEQILIMEQSANEAVEAVI